MPRAGGCKHSLYIITPSPILQHDPAAQALAPGADTQLDAAALEAVAAGAPVAELPRGAVVGALLADVLAAVGLQPSKAAARRLIKVRDLPCMGREKALAALPGSAVVRVRSSACCMSRPPRRQVGSHSL